MAKETWLITGGAGFIGAATAKELLQRGRKVIIFDDFSASTRDSLAAIKKQTTIIKGDICDYPALLKAAKKADVMLHLAALVSVPASFKDAEYSYKVNIGGTLNALNAAANSNIKKFIFASTAAVYGDNPPPNKEDGPVSCASPYAAGKLFAEELCLKYHNSQRVNCVILRYFNAYGPGQSVKNPYAGVITKFLNAAKRGLPLTIYGDGKQTRDFVFIDDIVKANMWAAAGRARVGKVYNVGTGEHISLLKLTGIIEKLIGKKCKINFKPARKGDVQKSRADITRIKAQKFNFDYPLVVGLKKML